MQDEGVLCREPENRTSWHRSQLALQSNRSHGPGSSTGRWGQHRVLERSTMVESMAWTTVSSGGLGLENASVHALHSLSCPAYTADLHRLLRGTSGSISVTLSDASRLLVFAIHGNLHETGLSSEVSGGVPRGKETRGKTTNSLAVLANASDHCPVGLSHTIFRGGQFVSLSMGVSWIFSWQELALASHLAPSVHLRSLRHL